MVITHAKKYKLVVRTRYIWEGDWTLTEIATGWTFEHDILYPVATADMRQAYDNIAADLLARARHHAAKYKVNLSDEYTKIDARGYLTVRTPRKMEKWVAEYIASAQRRPHLFVGWPELLQAINALPQPIAEEILPEVLYFAEQSEYANMIEQLRAANIIVEPISNPNIILDARADIREHICARQFTIVDVPQFKDQTFVYLGGRIWHLEDIITESFSVTVKKGARAYAVKQLIAYLTQK